MLRTVFEAESETGKLNEVQMSSGKEPFGFIASQQVVDSQSDYRAAPVRPFVFVSTLISQIASAKSIRVPEKGFKSKFTHQATN